MSHEDTWRADTRKIILAWVKSEEGRRALVHAHIAAQRSWGFSEEKLFAAMEAALTDEDNG